MKLKDWLLGSLGAVGWAIWYFLCFSFVIVPILATDLPIWACIILLVLVFFTDFIGAIVSVFAYCYGAYVVLNGPFTAFCAGLFVFFSVYVLFFFIP